MTDVISKPNVLINSKQVFLVYAILLLNYTLFTSHIPSLYGKHDFMLYTVCYHVYVAWMTKSGVLEFPISHRIDWWRFGKQLLTIKHCMHSGNHAISINTSDAKAELCTASGECNAYSWISSLKPSKPSCILHVFAEFYNLRFTLLIGLLCMFWHFIIEL